MSPQRVSRRLVRSLAIGGGLLMIAAVIVLAVRHFSMGEPEANPVAVTVPTEIRGLEVPPAAKIGVIVTFGTATGEGSEWNLSAHGAVVAQQRLASGDTDIELVVENDGGTAAGAQAALDRLTDEGVAGIVYASSGPHIEAALRGAPESSIPVILPYETAPAGVDDIWSLAVDDDAFGSVLAETLSDAAHPLHIDAGGDLPAAVAVGDAIRFPGTDIDAFADDIAVRTGADLRAYGVYSSIYDDDGETVGEPVPLEVTNDAIVMSGHAVTQARLLYALQARNVTVPVILGPEAVSPAFSATLRELGGTVSSNLRTIGSEWSDAKALETDAAGRAMSAFLAAVRQLAGDDRALNLTGDAPFADVADHADVRSHDAILILVAGIDAAESADPGRVAEAIGGLSLAAGDGLAGPALDLSAPQALIGDVTVLYASNQRLGLRPHAGSPAQTLVWFPEPAPQ